MKKYKLSEPCFEDEDLKYVVDVIKTGMLVQGVENKKFEAKIGTYFGIDEDLVSLVSSGTAALHLALLALEIGTGDKVIVPNFTFPATSNVVEIVGAKCLFVDVVDSNYNINADILEKALKENIEDVKAIIVVHEFGAPCDMNKIMNLARKYEIKIIEDAACAFGTKCDDEYAGLIGDVGCFSLHPRKAITTGEGGIVISKSKDVIERINILKNHGICNLNGKIDFITPGLNYRMTNFQAALGLKQLDNFDDWINKRVKLQEAYRNKLNYSKIRFPENQKGHSWQSFMILMENEELRDWIKFKLSDLGIESNYGAYALNTLSYYKDKYQDNRYLDGSAEMLYSCGLCLPLHHGLSEDDVCYISEQIILLCEDYYGNK